MFIFCFSTFIPANPALWEVSTIKSRLFSLQKFPIVSISYIYPVTLEIWFITIAFVSFLRREDKFFINSSVVSTGSRKERVTFFSSSR